MPETSPGFIVLPYGHTTGPYGSPTTYQSSVVLRPDPLEGLSYTLVTTKVFPDSGSGGGDDDAVDYEFDNVRVRICGGSEPEKEAVSRLRSFPCTGYLRPRARLQLLKHR